MRILGIHDGHNAAAALLVDGRVVAAVQEERFNREKNWSGIPVESIKWILESTGHAPADVDVVAMNGHHMPFPKDRDTILREYRQTGSRLTSIKRLARATPLKTIYSRRRREERITQLQALGFPAERIEFVEHHTCHAAAPYYGWGRYDEPVLVLTNDGAGDFVCASVNVGRGGKLAGCGKTG